MARVVASTPARGDQDHIRLLVDHNPKVPNRHSSIAGTGPSAAPDLVSMARRLEAAGADFLVMVCNTAHAYSEEIRAAVNIPFISIIDVVIEALPAHGVEQVGIMAAEGCLRANLYQEALQNAGYLPVVWSDSELEEFMQLVGRIKGGEYGEDIGNSMRGLAGGLQQRGAQLLIVGCTEIPLVLSDADLPVPVLVSTDLLVQRTIALALNKQ
jgi:aspartate racemase